MNKSRFLCLNTDRKRADSIPLSSTKYNFIVILQLQFFFPTNTSLPDNFSLFRKSLHVVKSATIISS